MCAIDYAAETNWVELTNVIVKKARKTHCCDECGRQIFPGESYRYETGLNDGYFETYKRCDHCAVAANWLIAQCGGFVTCGILEDLEEHLNEVEDWRGIARLVIGMRRRWRQVRKGHQGLMRLQPSPRVDSH